jgi:hypothetical protein
MSSFSRETASESAFSLFASLHVVLLPLLWLSARHVSKVQAVGKMSLHDPMVLVQCSASYTYIKLWESTQSSKNVQTQYIVFSNQPKPRET